MAPNDGREWTIAMWDDKPGGNMIVKTFILKINQHGLAFHLDAEFGEIEWRPSRVIEVRSKLLKGGRIIRSTLLRKCR